MKKIKTKKSVKSGGVPSMANSSSTVPSDIIQKYRDDSHLESHQNIESARYGHIGNFWDMPGFLKQEQARLTAVCRFDKINEIKAKGQTLGGEIKKHGALYLKPLEKISRNDDEAETALSRTKRWPDRQNFLFVVKTLV